MLEYVEKIEKADDTALASGSILDNNKGMTPRQPCHDDVSCEPPILKVLVVEDDACDFALIEHCLTYLARYEPQTTLAGTIEAAQFALAAGEFDVMLFDYGMDSQNGMALLANHVLGESGVPCILLSNHLTPEIEREAIAFGGAACIAKSELSIPVLNEVLHKVLTGIPVTRTQEVLAQLRLTSDARKGTVQQNAASKHFVSTDQPSAAFRAVRPRASSLADRVLDAQALVLEAAAATRQKAAARGARNPDIFVELQDWPVYVRGNERAILHELNFALTNLADVSVTARFEFGGLWHEIAIEASPPRPLIKRVIAKLQLYQYRSGGFVVAEPEVGRISILLPSAESKTCVVRQSKLPVRTH